MSIAVLWPISIRGSTVGPSDVHAQKTNRIDIDASRSRWMACSSICVEVLNVRNLGAWEQSGRVCLHPFWRGCLMLPVAVERC
jgi:hypothetical protein